MKIIVTKAYEVPDNLTYCTVYVGINETELCQHYRNPKVKGGRNNHKRKHVCTLFEVELKTSRMGMTKHPEKCAGCLSATQAWTEGR